MAALTQQQYYEKLRAMVPPEFFEKENINVAIFNGIAAVFARLHQDAEDHFKETMIKYPNATELFLDSHGEERNVERLSAEPDPVYSERVRNITNSSDVPAIKAIVDALLINGESTILENNEARIFASREQFYSRGDLFTEIFYNVFTIVVENQLHDPYSFTDREYFFSREDFLGATESDLAIFQQISAAVDKAKAFGVLYRILERQQAA